VSKIGKVENVDYLRLTPNINNINRRIQLIMKRKFFSVLFALVLVLSMGLMTAAPAMAATAVTDVWVEFDDASNNMNTVSDTGNEYIIHFKPTTALVAGMDWVTVTFPDGSSAMGGSGSTYAFSIAAAPAAADLEFSTPGVQH